MCLAEEEVARHPEDDRGQGALITTSIMNNSNNEINTIVVSRFDSNMIINIIVTTNHNIHMVVVSIIESNIIISITISFVSLLYLSLS